MTWMDWYQRLAKPEWTPSPSTIGLIWQILYPLIAVTFSFVFYQAIRGTLPFRTALPYIINLFANILFPLILFSFHNLMLASIDILIVLCSIVWMIVSIWAYHKWVAFLQVPYLTWVAIATIIQFWITWMNW